MSDSCRGPFNLLKTYVNRPTLVWGNNNALNLLTLDLEDWFHICQVEHLLPRKDWDRLPSTVVADTQKFLGLLQRSGYRATFFVLGYVADRYPDLIRRIHHMGHEIAYHGWDHELVYDLTPHEFHRILRKGIKCIEALTGKRPIGFRAPQWSINDRSIWALEILAEEGFVYDSSMAPVRFIGNEAYPRIPHLVSTPAGGIWELPPLTLNTSMGNYPAGGGWGLRFLPYLILKQAVRRMNRQHIPALFYFHPREFSRRRSVAGLPAAKKFVLHAGIWGSEAQLLRLLTDFHFTSLEQYLNGGLDYETSPP
ncbi:MAG: DUF3473 domain-containing protein [Desulfobacterales bacterium]|nr:DUF3473 domain-containing protein [Desulfobacterales bacterium]